MIKRMYIDNAALTPIDPRVVKEMEKYSSADYANPSSLHKEGVAAKKALEDARKRIARMLHVRPQEVVFTASGTESDNLALRGVVSAFARTQGEKAHIITSTIEHAAVLETVRALEREGFAEVSYLTVNEFGLIDPKQLKELLRKNTAIVSVVYANSEVGTIQPVGDMVKMLREYKKTRGVTYPYIHTDACQAMNYCESNLERLGVDLLTFNGSKMYGPRGIGVLYVRDGVNIDPIFCGGGQERGLRSGTENLPAITGLAKALEITEGMKKTEAARLVEVRDYCMRTIEKKLPEVRINGDRVSRLPNNVHVTVPDMEDDVLVIELDVKGVACSSKSACKSATGAESHVILAMVGETKGSHLRFSFGRHTTKKDIDYVVSTLQTVLEKYKQISR